MSCDMTVFDHVSTRACQRPIPGLSVRIGATFPLRDAGKAHDALESRATTGKVVLLP